MSKLTPLVPPESFSRRVARITGKTPAAWFSLAQSGGYTPAQRLVVHFAGGGSAFVKAATTDLTTEWLRMERKMYERLEGKSFLPAYLGADDGAEEGELPLLVLEDLSGCVWPPPWSEARVQAVLETLADVHATGTEPALSELSQIADEKESIASWHHVAADPEPFLSLGFCSRDWLDHALPDLIIAQETAPLAGTDLLHLDIRSDNICFRPDGRAILVDWNWACRGNRTLDIAGWLPSLHAEGGPLPESVGEAAGVYAALLAGFFAFRAGQTPIPNAPRVRDVQKQQLTVALPWAARVLGLPAPDTQN